MRKFTKSILGKGVTFTKLCKVRDKRGRVDYARKDIDGIVVENDGYVATVRGWDGVLHTNVETAEMVTWAEADQPLDMPCLD